VHVPGSRRYADPGSYLLTPEQWAPRQTEFCVLVGKLADGRHALEQGVAELQVAVAEFETVLARPAPPVETPAHSPSGSRDPLTVTATSPAANTRPAQVAAPRSCGGRAGQIQGLLSAGPCHCVYSA